MAVRRKSAQTREHDKASPTGSHAIAQRQDSDTLGRLHSTAGNRAVQRMMEGVKPDSNDVDQAAAPAATPKVPAPEKPAPEPAAPAPAERTPAPETPEKQVVGTIPDIVTPLEEARETSPEGGVMEGSAGPAEELASAGGMGNVSADLQLSFSQPRRDGLTGGKHDAITSAVSSGSFSQPGGLAVSPFGAERFQPAFTGISYAFSGGKCTITANLDVNCPWGTNSGGNIDVPSETAAVITKQNWRKIKTDLTPSSSSPYKSPRDKYYSQTLVEKHEKFHGTDDNAWTQSSGLGIVKTFIETQTVSPSNAEADVNGALNEALVRLRRENTKYYKGSGSSHDAFAGEIRAYADGKSEYQKLADGVEKHGKSLP